jgi:LemA protein
MTFGGVVFLLVLVGLIAAIILTYNKLVGLRQRSDEAWSDIDVQLKRRTDLVPNLVECRPARAGHVIRSFGAGIAAVTAGFGARVGRNQLTERCASSSRTPVVSDPRRIELSGSASLGELEEMIDSRRFTNAVVRD